LTLWQRFKAWWTLPESDEPDLAPERRDEIIEWTAQQVKRFGMITPAYIFADMNRPVMFVASQFVHFFSPFADSFLGGKAQEVGYLLQDPENLDKFLARLEELGRSEDAEEKKAREAKRGARRAATSRRRGSPPPGAGPENPESK
jgi:hypothetical protein